MPHTAMIDDNDNETKPSPCSSIIVSVKPTTPSPSCWMSPPSRPPCKFGGLLIDSERQVPCRTQVVDARVAARRSRSARIARIICAGHPPATNARRTDLNWAHSMPARFQKIRVARKMPPVGCRRLEQPNHQPRDFFCEQLNKIFQLPSCLRVSGCSTSLALATTSTSGICSRCSCLSYIDHSGICSRCSSLSATSTNGICTSRGSSPAPLSTTQFNQPPS